MPAYEWGERQAVLSALLTVTPSNDRLLPIVGGYTMWVQSRRTGEKLVLPSLQVTLRVLEIRGDRVRLGISVPAGTLVQYLEVWHPAGQAGPSPPKAEAPTG